MRLLLDAAAGYINDTLGCMNLHINGITEIGDPLE
jgi:hypothetical protein